MREKNLDAIRGCIFGGAVGDALGYPVEFDREEAIFAKYGPGGITSYELDPASGKAIISDDTQMTLFTANGLLVGNTGGCIYGFQAAPRAYVAQAYHDWFMTQYFSIEEVNRHKRGTRKGGYSWLLDVPELYSRRAPGSTCLSSLAKKVSAEDYLKLTLNKSKGCGGVMRVAPLAVDYQTRMDSISQLDLEGAQLAAITHSHPLGYMPAAALVHIINRIVYPPQGKEMSLREIVVEARYRMAELFSGEPYLARLLKLMDLAVDLADQERAAGEGILDTSKVDRLSGDMSAGYRAGDLKNIHKLGEGWVAEETLAIAIYCALRYQEDFSAAMIASVNHNGDSDSTGAVTGNILGALHGYKAIDDCWKEKLELKDVILQIADDLCYGCQLSEHSPYADPEWRQKYIRMHIPVEKKKYLFFWKAEEEHGCFSNWYPCKFVIDDFEYLHVEQYMMASKAKLFHDSAIYTAVLRATAPRECKNLGRKVYPFSDDQWDAVKYEVVKKGNRAKFDQNPALKEALLNTEDAILAEASPIDTLWGIGMDADRAAGTNMADWPGENLLGRVLMELREEYKAKGDQV